MSNGSGSNPCSHPPNHILGDPPMTIAPSSMVCYGSSALEPLGGIFRSVMVPGGRWPAASTAGRRRVSSAESFALKEQADGNGQLNWALHYVDSTIIRAHQHAAGAKKGILRSRR